MLELGTAVPQWWHFNRHRCQHRGTSWCTQFQLLLKHTTFANCRYGFQSAINRCPELRADLVEVQCDAREGLDDSDSEDEVQALLSCDHWINDLCEEGGCQRPGLWSSDHRMPEPGRSRARCRSTWRSWTCAAARRLWS